MGRAVETASKADDWPIKFVQRLNDDEARLMEQLEATRTKMLA